MLDTTSTQIRPCSFHGSEDIENLATINSRRKRIYRNNEEGTFTHINIGKCVTAFNFIIHCFYFYNQISERSCSL